MIEARSLFPMVIITDIAEIEHPNFVMLFLLLSALEAKAANQAGSTSACRHKKYFHKHVVSNS